MINLEKDVERVNDTLKKKKQVINCEVASVLDCSLSAEPFYTNGFYQSVVERCLPIAMVVDNDKKIDSWIFDTRFKKMLTITVDNISNYINNFVKRHCTWGGTLYTPVLEDVLKTFKAEKHWLLWKKSKRSPVLVLFYTDGENGDTGNFTKFLLNTTRDNLFIQIIGIGISDNIKEKMSTIARSHHHVGFIAMDTIKAIDDEDLYDGLISNKFITWYNQFKG